MIKIRSMVRIESFFDLEDFLKMQVSFKVFLLQANSAIPLRRNFTFLNLKSFEIFSTLTKLISTPLYSSQHDFLVVISLFMIQLHDP